jgi:hypothetical protein
MPIVLPHESRGSGHTFWHDITPQPVACAWLCVQHHRFQNPDRTTFSELFRSATADPYAHFPYRVITSRAPYLVLAVEKSEEVILADYRLLTQSLSLHPTPPPRAELSSMIVRLLDEQRSAMMPAPLSLPPQLPDTETGITAESEDELALVPEDARFEIIVKDTSVTPNLLNFRSVSTSLYLRADRDDATVVNFVPHCRGWETWQQVPLGRDHVAFLSKHNTYLQGLPDGSLAQSLTTNEWTAWKVVALPGFRFAYKSVHGHFLRVSVHHTLLHRERTPPPPPASSASSSTAPY